MLHPFVCLYILSKNSVSEMPSFSLMTVVAALTTAASFNCIHHIFCMDRDNTAARYLPAFYNFSTESVCSQNKIRLYKYMVKML